MESMELLRQQLADANTQIAKFKAQIIALEGRIKQGCPLLAADGRTCSLVQSEKPLFFVRCPGCRSIVPVHDYCKICGIELPSYPGIINENG